MHATLRKPKQTNGHKIKLPGRLGMTSIGPDRQAASSSPAKASPGELKIHPLAQLPPALSDSDYAALEADCLRAGIRDEIVLLDGKILDGRHKYRIAVEHKLKFRTRDYDLKTEGDPIGFVYSKSCGRNMDESQKAAAAVLFVEELDRTGKAWDGRKPGETSRDALGKFFGVNGRYVQDMQMLRKKSAGLFDEVYQGRRTVAKAVAEWKRQEKADELKKKAEKAKAVKNTGKPWRLINGDALVEVPKLKEKASLVFVDPPYNFGLDYGLGKDKDSRPEGEYLKWCEEWICLLGDALADDGSMFVMIDNRHQYRFACMMEDAAQLHFRNTIIWVETFGSYTNHNFTSSVRFVHYFTKHKTRCTWNETDIRVPSCRNLNDDVRGDKEGKVPGNYWEFHNPDPSKAIVMPVARVVGNAGERMQFPTQLNIDGLRRIVRVASNPGELVLDCFNGSGTTGAAAIELGRRYVGIDIVSENIRWAETRLLANCGDRYCVRKHPLG